MFALASCGPFAHTDDGCAFEIHCRICLWVAGSIGLVEAVVAATPVLEPATLLAPPPPSAIHDGRVATPASRGPPLNLDPLR